MSDSTRSQVKSAARETVDSLPEDTTWDEVIYRLYVRQKIEAGLADAEAGNLIPTDEVRRRLGRGHAS
ncbi:MAG: hypothetical protein ACQESR_01450 [Planctomycetota bacterium]